MIEAIKKRKKIIKDLFFNTFGFGIYMIAQQIILLPIMAQVFPEAEFSKIALYISVYAIITNVLGSELGIVRQVKQEEVNSSSDYNRIMLQLLPLIIIVSIISLVAFGFNSVEILLLTITIILGNIRLYSAAYFRLNKDFKNVVIQNIIYLIGIVLGIAILYVAKFIWIPMLLTEVLCLIFDLVKTDLVKGNIAKTAENKNIWKTFKNFGFISFLGVILLIVLGSIKFIILPLSINPGVSIKVISSFNFISNVSSVVEGIILDVT